MSTRASSPNLNLPLPRQRALARSLHARLFVSAEGRIFIARGRPDLAKLRNCLARIHHAPSAGEAPTPLELGIPICDGELTPHTMHAISRALKRWEGELAGETRRSLNRRRAEQHAREEHEIEQLKLRLATCYRWQRELFEGREPAAAPYLLDPLAEAELRQALEEAENCCHFPPSVRWLARVVFWISGSHALSRFLQALTRLAKFIEHRQRWEHVFKLQRQLHIWKKRSLTEPPLVLRAELRSALAKLPQDVVRLGKLTARPRKRSFVVLCDVLIARTKSLLERCETQPWQCLPAELAALAACDGATTPLPWRRVERCLEENDHPRIKRLFRRLSAEAGQPAYNGLLVALNQLDPLPYETEFGSIRRLLARGASQSDIAWASEHNLLSELGAACVTPTWVRNVWLRFAQRGLPLGIDDLSRLVSSLASPQQTVLVERWLAWVDQLPRRELSLRLRKLLLNSLLEWMLPSVKAIAAPDLFRDWLAALASPHGHGAPDASDVASPCLDRIATYRRLAGLSGAIPKSVRDLLARHDAQRRERAYLEVRRAKGDASEQQQLRLAHLLAHREPDQRDGVRLTRVAEESLVPIALDALRQTIRQAAGETWRRRIESTLPEMPFERLLRVIKWLGEMTERQRILLRQVLTGWQRHGVEYKRHLPDNRPWLTKAAAQGINGDRWLRPEPQAVTIGGQTLRVGIEHSPWEIFLMGEYFSTCLRFGGCNQLSVLTNAHDANKQTLFMVAQGAGVKRQVVARQLVAVSSDFRLVGYHCYVGYENQRKADREEALLAMAGFCGRLARRCGLPLSNEGAPENLGQQFWHDDGVWKWHAAAHEAWKSESEDARTELSGPPLDPAAIAAPTFPLAT